MAGLVRPVIDYAAQRTRTYNIHESTYIDMYMDRLYRLNGLSIFEDSSLRIEGDSWSLVRFALIDSMRVCFPGDFCTFYLKR